MPLAMYEKYHVNKTKNRSLVVGVRVGAAGEIFFKISIFFVFTPFLPILGLVGGEEGALVL